jgi:hypothetical protein
MEVLQLWRRDLTRIARLALRLDRVGRLKRPPACMRKPRSKNWPNGRCAQTNRKLPGSGDCSRKSKAFRSELAARWTLAAIACEVCQTG